MKYPLNWFHSFCRETTCFFRGHQWKSSPRQHTKYWDVEYEDIPYGLRKTTGNALWENVAWWSYKCPRCRWKVRTWNDAKEVWYKKQYYAMRDALWTIKWHIKYFNEEHPNVSGLPALASLIVIPLIGVMQYMMHFESMPWTWWSWISDLEYWWYCKLSGE